MKFLIQLFNLLPNKVLATEAAALSARALSAATARLIPPIEGIEVVPLPPFITLPRAIAIFGNSIVMATAQNIESLKARLRSVGVQNAGVSGWNGDRTVPLVLTVYGSLTEYNAETNSTNYVFFDFRYNHILPNPCPPNPCPPPVPCPPYYCPPYPCPPDPYAHNVYPPYPCPPNPCPPPHPCPPIKPTDPLSSCLELVQKGLLSGEHSSLMAYILIFLACCGKNPNFPCLSLISPCLAPPCTTTTPVEPTTTSRSRYTVPRTYTTTTKSGLLNKSPAELNWFACNTLDNSTIDVSPTITNQPVTETPPEVVSNSKPVTTSAKNNTNTVTTPSTSPTKPTVNPAD